MEYQQLGNQYLIRLDRGEEVIDRLLFLLKKENITAAYLTGIGACDEVDVGLYNVQEQRYFSKTFLGEFEITNLSGNVSQKDNAPYLHLHITCCRDSFESFGGHLAHCRISGTCEIALTLIEGTVERHLESETGLNVWDFPRKFPQTMDWVYDSKCFACGEDNPIGLKLKFEQLGEDTVRTSFVPEENYQSWPGIMHGGLTATIADEVMGRCVNMLGYAGMTARLELRYRKAAPLGEKIIFEAKATKVRLPIIDLETKAFLADGTIVLEASARFMVKGTYEAFIKKIKGKKEAMSNES